MTGPDREGPVAVAHPFNFFVGKSSAGEPVNSCQSGLIALVRALEEVKPIENIEDVRGIELIDPGSHPESDFTLPFRYAIVLLKEQNLLR